MTSPQPSAQESANYWAAVLARINEGVLLLEADGTIAFANDQGLRLFDLPLDIVGQPFSDAVAGPELAALINAASKDEEIAQRDVTVNRTGQTRVFSVRASRLDSATEKKPGVLLILSDVTAERALEEIGSDFVANVSHELRTPISILTGYIENLADFPRMPRPEQAEIFDIMQEHATRLTALLDDLLTLARFDSHSDVLNYEELDLHEFFTRLAKDWHRALTSKDMDVVLEIAEEARFLAVDRFRFEQVMHNLFDNAYKYSPIESQIRVRSSRVNGHIEISVEDNGSGIPEEDLPYIFERFYRVDKGRSRQYGGTGLGLSIVKHIVSLHGGSVRAESTLGMSTRIILRLPPTPPEA